MKSKNKFHLLKVMTNVFATANDYGNNLLVSIIYTRTGSGLKWAPRNTEDQEDEEEDEEHC